MKGENAVQSPSSGARRLASPRARLAAEEILSVWIRECDRLPLDRIVQAELRSRRQLNSSERRWIADAVFGSVRYWRRQTSVLERAGFEPEPRARIELWINESDSHGVAGPLTAQALPGPDQPGRYLRETLSFSDEMAEALESSLGPDAIPAALSFNRQAPTTLRVNTLRATRNRVMSRIPKSAATRFSPWGLELEGRVNLHDVPGYHEGWIEVQEEASQLIALLTDAQPGQTIVEVGAGAGGKSLALAAMMRNSGALIAADTSGDRLAQLAKRTAHGGAKIVRPLLLNADEDGRWQLSGDVQRTVSRLVGKADCVLLDAPCSGSGVMRRAPDVKWRQEDLSRYARLQVLLLEQSSNFVAHNGCLVYATCAFERAQNEAVVEQFLASVPGQSFELTDALDRLKRSFARLYPHAAASGPGGHRSRPEIESMRSGPFLRTWPHLHNLDAFFAACLIRKQQRDGGLDCRLD